MKIQVICSPGLGDFLIFHIASYHLQRAGWDVETITPHQFGWLPRSHLDNIDAILLQEDNGPLAQKVKHANVPVYRFIGSYREEKHGPLNPNLDFVADLKQPMVENVVNCLKTLFHIDATKQNGLQIPPHLQHRKFPNRVLLHTTSGDIKRNWPLDKFEKIASFLKQEGFEPTFLPLFDTVDELASYIYESGYFIGNDSGPGHLASLLQIPHVILGREAKHMLHWRPGWLAGEILTPPPFKFCENRWRHFISVNSVKRAFYRIKCN